MTWLWIVIIAAVGAAFGFARSTQQEEELLSPKRRLLLLPLANPRDVPTAALYEWAADCLRVELGLDVQLQSRPVPIPKEALHPQRSQANAVYLVEQMERLVTPEFAVLGLTEYDLYSPLRRDLPFALGARKGQAGLISSFRMEDKAHPDNTKERLRKMLVRYGAELVCDAQRNQDPTSVLYQELQRPEQLDLMEWPVLA